MLNIILLIYFIFSLYGYFFLSDGINLSNEIAVITGVLYIVISILYLKKYRRQNLMCYDTLFLLIYLIVIYLPFIIIESIESDNIKNIINITNTKVLFIETSAFCSFIYGSIVGNKITTVDLKKSRSSRKFLSQTGIKIVSNLLNIILFIFLLYLFVSGTISSWYKYIKHSDLVDDSSMSYLTILMLVYGVIEFYRLFEIRITNLGEVLSKINKGYIIFIVLISVLMLISGNRNEALLILLPPIIYYSIYIKQISNRVFFIGLIVGWASMIVIGLTRQTGVSYENVVNSKISFYDSMTDLVSIPTCTNYLVSYSDQHGYVYFSDLVTGVASAIPFFGGFMNQIFPPENPPSQQLTTQGIIGNGEGGFGTSLIGDLYYHGGIVFTLLYLFSLGWIMSKIFNRSYVLKNKSVFNCLAYAYMFSNVIYAFRAEWMTPIRTIAFSFILLLIIRSFFSKTT